MNAGDREGINPMFWCYHDVNSGVQSRKDNLKQSKLDIKPQAADARQQSGRDGDVTPMVSGRSAQLFDVSESGRFSLMQNPHSTEHRVDRKVEQNHRGVIESKVPIDSDDFSGCQMATPP